MLDNLIGAPPGIPLRLCHRNPPVYIRTARFPIIFYVSPGCYAGGEVAVFMTTPAGLTTSGGTFSMATPVSLMDHQMVDMAFITQLTGLTDKWFYKLIKVGGFPAPIQNGAQLPLAEK